MPPGLAHGSLPLLHVVLKYGRVVLIPASKLCPLQYLSDTLQGICPHAEINRHDTV